MSRNLKRPTKESVRQYLVSSAWERQKLGLTKTEYDALTPFEIKCELEALKFIEREKNNLVEILDEHFARLEILANGYIFADLKTTEDFRIFKPKKFKEISDKQRKNNTKKNFEMAIKLKALQDKIKAKRDAIRSERKG
jgi:hypothetical protein